MATTAARSNTGSLGTMSRKSKVRNCPKMYVLCNRFNIFDFFLLFVCFDFSRAKLRHWEACKKEASTLSAVLLVWIIPNFVLLIGQPFCLRIQEPFHILEAISRGRRSGGEDFVFRIVQHNQLTPIEIMANSSEDLHDWVLKIHEASQAAKDKVSSTVNYHFMCPLMWLLILILSLLPFLRSGKARKWSAR